MGNEKERDYQYVEIFQRHFRYQRLSNMLKYLHKINDKYKNSKLVNVIKSRLSDLNQMKPKT